MTEVLHFSDALGGYGKIYTFISYDITADAKKIGIPVLSGYQVAWALPSGDIYQHRFDEQTGKTDIQPIENTEQLYEYIKNKYHIDEAKIKQPIVSPPTFSSDPPPEALADTDAAIAVCTTPDVCKTPVGSSTPPIPYQVWGKAGDDQNYSPDIFLNGHPAMRLDSKFTKTYGDEPGVAKGIKSGTTGDVIEPTSNSTIVRYNGQWAIRHGDACTLNNGNCTGEFIFTEDRNIYKGPQQSDNNAESQDTRSEGQKFSDGFTENAEETWDAAKTVARSGWEASKDLASAMYDDPLGTVGNGLSSLWTTGVNAATWVGEVGKNLATDPAGTIGRGVNNTLETGSAIWTAVSEPYQEAYKKGGLSQAIGHGSFDIFKTGIELVATKGAITAASKGASIGSKVATATTKMKRLDDAAEDGVHGARITSKLRKIPCFEMPPGMDAKEFDRQLAEQMSVINSMTADDMAYAMWVRDTAGGTKKLRDGTKQAQHRDDYKNFLEKAGWKEDEIDEHMQNLQATHMLDIVAGGDPLSFSRDAAGNPILGHGDVNEQIGREWIRKDENGIRKADHLRDEAANKRKMGLHHEKLNVELKRCK